MFEADLQELEALPYGGGVDELLEPIHRRMREVARGAPDRVVEWAGALDPHDLEAANHLMSAIEALAPEGDHHLAFFTGQLARLLAAGAEQPASKPVFQALGAFQFVAQHPAPRLHAALRGQLLAALKTPVASIRRASVDLLAALGLDQDASSQSALVAALKDEDWKVRALAEDALREANLLPAGYKTPFFDQLRRKTGGWTEYV